jgi:hypothetical protein
VHMQILNQGRTWSTAIAVHIAGNKYNAGPSRPNPKFHNISILSDKISYERIIVFKSTKLI